jgi:hypothetical protein
MPRDEMPSYMIPSVSVYYKVSYDNKDKFKKYGAIWQPSNKEWKIRIEGCHADSWQPIHDKIMTINKELKICGSKIHSIEDIVGYLDEYNTFKLVLGKPREDPYKCDKKCVSCANRVYLNCDLQCGDCFNKKIKLCPECGDVKDSADCFRDCNKCYRENINLQRNTCLDCHRSIDREFARCFKCNAEQKTIKIIDLMEKKVCLITDD